MDYLYENLGDERFQQFCSCLISKEFPNAQAFPVGQPDGGRDSLAYLITSPKKEFIVFQVKYVRNQNNAKDTHKWLTGIIEGEVEKIDKLIPKGAKMFYLLTNVRGTAHLDVGSKDRINKILENNIKIPSICLWREDITMLFEKDPIFKWSYPEIINGQDILNSVLFNNLNENRERRENVIKAYLADQYKMDNEVKFRQIDLQNGLFNLFTDVPIRIKKFNEKDKELRHKLEGIEFIQRKHLLLEDVLHLEERIMLGAAEFLLHPKVQNEIGQILLEGGPGQGKSTISQYVSQVHRARLLNKTSDIELIPDKIKNVPIRLPFKIDLRHVAAWVENKNPYIGILSDEYFLRIWHKSLESFLVGHIFYHSKLEDFNSIDFIAICKLSPILLVFDGFDEIANLKVREEVIDFINRGINRISENSKSIQVIITSRPSAFSDSIGFSIDTYPHFELTDITPTITQEYVEKWIKASRLDGREASEIRRLVREKLEMPHLRDLAKSPMQLAIFISLLRTRGESLPNKRTELYNSYVELFFNRESEKNSTIRDYRDLIIEIHEYLAWVLHSEAELYKNNGTIHIDELKKRLNEYLLKEGHQTDITDKLFQVVQERVCALVSRLQGTFEFEVQPLREYFCAKHLYKTSPYSPVGAERSGTLPDRFDAISRNFYWQNVLRFFAGCFSKGELSMLIQKLRELVDDSTLKYTDYPRIVTSLLLADYVFTQYPLHLGDVVRIIIDGINIGNIINQAKMSSNNELIMLPEECGRKEVVIECFRQLKLFPASDYASELIGLIKNNPYKVVENWSENLKVIEGEKLSIWLEYAYLLEIIHKINENVLVDIIYRDGDTYIMNRLQLLINGNRLDIVEKYPDLKKMLIDGLLQGDIHMRHRRKSVYSSLHFLSILLNPWTLSRSLGLEYSNVNFKDSLLRFYPYYLEEEQETSFGEFPVNDLYDESIFKYSESIKTVLTDELSIWRSSIEPWDVLVENGRSFFGDSWCFYNIASISAGIKQREDIGIYETVYNLNDSAISLCRRARYARMKSGNIKYWEEQFKDCENILFKLLLFFTWATAKTIIKLLRKVEPLIDVLTKDDFKRLDKSIKRVSINYFSKTQKKLIIDEINNNSVKNSLKYLICLRFHAESQQQFVCEKIDDSTGDVDEVNELKLDFLIKKYFSNTSDEVVLSDIKEVYKKVKLFGYRSYYHQINHSKDHVKIPFEIAKRIMSDCKEFPKRIVVLAEKSCRINAYEHMKPVGEIAKNEKWFG